MKKYVLLNGRKYEFIPLFTKKFHYFMKSYYMSDYKNINQAYKYPSAKKVQIFSEILNEMYKNGGFAIRIISKNCSFFSCAYTVEINERHYLVIETPTSSYIALITTDITCNAIDY